MSKITGKLIRKIALILMIVFDVFMIAILFIKGMYFWACLFVIISVLVGMFEVMSKKFTGHTISTRMKNWIRRDKFWGLVTMLLMLLGFVSLVVHLAVFW